MDMIESLLGGSGPLDISRWFDSLGFDDRIAAVSTRVKKDADRVELFGLATQRWYTNAIKELVSALVRGDLSAVDAQRARIVAFTSATAAFSREWVTTIESEAERLRKLNLWNCWPFIAKLPSYDPLAPMRERARIFVRDWKLGEDIARVLDVKGYVA